MEYFDVTTEDVSGLGAMVQTLDTTAATGAPMTLSLRVIQTVGDGKTLYVFFTVGLPDEWHESLRVGDNNNGLSVTADAVLFPYDSEEELNDPPEKTVWSSTGTDYRYLPKENALACVLRVYDRNADLNGRNLCLTLRGVTVSTREGDEPLAQIKEDLSIMWTAENTAEWRSFEGNSGLVCRLSPLCLDLSGIVEGAAVEEGRELRDTVLLLDADGAILSDLRMAVSGSASLTPDGTAHVDLTAHQGFFDDFSKAAAISIGGVTYPIS